MWLPLPGSEESPGRSPAARASAHRSCSSPRGLARLHRRGATSRSGRTRRIRRRPGPGGAARARPCAHGQGKPRGRAAGSRPAGRGSAGANGPRPRPRGRNRRPAPPRNAPAPPRTMTPRGGGRPPPQARSPLGVLRRSPVLRRCSVPRRPCCAASWRRPDSQGAGGQRGAHGGNHLQDRSAWKPVTQRRRRWKGSPARTCGVSTVRHAAATARGRPAGSASEGQGARPSAAQGLTGDLNSWSRCCSKVLRSLGLVTITRCCGGKRALSHFWWACKWEHSEGDSVNYLWTRVNTKHTCWNLYFLKEHMRKVNKDHRYWFWTIIIIYTYIGIIAPHLYIFQ